MHRRAETWIVMLLATFGLGAGAFVQPAIAQIVFEGGGTPTQDVDDGNIIDVTDGTKAGDNLFLRFRQYDLDSGDKATYTNSTSDPDPTAVFNAIFDTKPSSINGEIASEYSADFYFLNPFGIVFGPDASFDIGGSLFVSSADQVEFSTGQMFEVAAGGSIPTLAASPVAFGFLGSDPGDIVFNGTDVELEDGEELHLIGGDIELRDTLIEIDSGRVRLVSLDSAGTFTLAGDDVSDFDSLGDILITSQRLDDEFEPEASIDVGGEGGGQIVARARNMILDDGVIGTGNETTALANPEDNAVDIRVRRALRVEGQSEILSDTEGAVRGDNIFLRADVLTMTGDSEISSDVEDGASGGGGRVVIEARVVNLRDSVEISTDTDPLATGAGGDIVIDAFERLNIDIDPPDVEAGILANSEGSGNAGTITIETADLRMSGGEISTRADQADGGGIAIFTDDGIVTLQDARITASVSTGGTGGSLELEAGAVLLDNSQLVAQAPNGTGGNIDVASEVFSAANSLVSATGQTDGTVEIESLDVDISAAASQLDSDFLDAQSLLKSRCETRQHDATKGRFSIRSGRGESVSPESVLLSFDAFDAATGAAGFRDIESRADLARNASQKLEAGQRSAVLERISDAFSPAPVVRSDIDAERVEALLAWGEAEQVVGRYEASLSPFERAMKLAEPAADKMLLARALAGLGTSHVALRNDDHARQLLERAARLALEFPGAKGGAGVLNNVANAHMIWGEADSALEAYAQSAEAAGRTGETIARARALAGGARMALVAGRNEDTQDRLLDAHAAAKDLPPGPQVPAILIHIAKTLEAYSLAVPSQRETSVLNAYYTLRHASELAGEFGDTRAKADALGNSALLYQREGLVDDAIVLVRRALEAAEISQAPESLYRWHWLEGQLLWASDKRDGALASYRRAAGILDVTRGESQARYGSSDAHFERGVAPVYLELIDRLLQRADDERPEDGVADASLPMLLEARATLERFKAAELRNYFHDECIAELDAKVRDLDEFAIRAAVIYPIMLKDRIELLVTLPEGLKRYRVDVKARELTRVARQFREHLAHPLKKGFKGPSRELYDWLVRPYADALSAQGVDTLVFVPDGALRSVPVAALHDGEQFLVAKYATAVTPGLGLIDPKPLDREDPRILLAGLSESVQGFSALPNVVSEVNEVNAIFDGDVLLNDAFGIDRVERLIEDEPFSIVHIATHAQFNGDADESFILTYDGKLDMNRLTETIGATRYRSEPLELLILSACQTAAGDDRAALGLAGVAIQAGARSALGSLWSISDSAAKELVVSFYRELQNPEVSKAQALQRAQLALLTQERFEHPFYWSPFLLINDWL